MVNVFKTKDGREKVILKSFSTQEEATQYIEKLHFRALKSLYLWRLVNVLPLDKHIATHQGAFEYSKVEPYTSDDGRASLRDAIYRIFIA